MKLKRILCALLSVCMISLPISMSVFSAGAESISSLQQKLEDLEKQNKDYQSILDKAESDIKDKEEYKDALVNKIKNLNDKIAITRESIEALNSDIEAKQTDINNANSDIKSQVDALCVRLRTIYMAGSASDLEIILGAKDFSDFVDKMELVKTLSNYDKKLIGEITDKLDSVSEQKESLENDKADLESKQDSLQADLDDLNDTLEKNEEILKNLYTESDNAKSAIESAVGESDEIQAKIASYYAKQAAAAQEAAQKAQEADKANNNSGSSNTDGSSSGSSGDITPSSSGFTWPCPGFYYLSSLWNEDRTTYNHGAIDIAGAGIMGASVVAADNGTVTKFREKADQDGTVVNAGFMVLEPQVIDYIDGDEVPFEKAPLERIAAEGQLNAFIHDGFWQCMDTKRDKDLLEKLIQEGNAPWIKWED